MEICDKLNLLALNDYHCLYENETVLKAKRCQETSKYTNMGTKNSVSISCG